MGRRLSKHQIQDRLETEKKWAKMEHNQPRNMIIILVMFIIMALAVIYRKMVGA